MDILGTQVTVEIVQGILHALVSVDRDKAAFWIEEIAAILAQPDPNPDILEQLIGRLSFASFAAYGPGSRSQLRSLIDFFHRRGTSSLQAREDLIWWVVRLREQHSRRVLLTRPELPPVIIYSDAEGTSCIGAVWADLAGEAVFASARIPGKIVKGLHQRRTQINAFEVIAAWCAVSAAPVDRTDRDVILFVDNTVAAFCIMKGSSSASDITAIVGCFWEVVERFRISLAVHWVPSAMNCADPPSRQRRPPLGASASYSKIHWHRLGRAIKNMC